MVGSSMVRALRSKGYTNIITAGRESFDYRNQSEVTYFIKRTKPEILILCAARVGGIAANMNNQASFLVDNIQMQNNFIRAAHEHHVEMLVFLGSSCVYPASSPQPIKEEYLLEGRLEPTNEGYALAKITGIKLLSYLKAEIGFNSISVMPCNLYGPGDSFDPINSHVLSALVRKFVDAKDNGLPNVINWGTGRARRELMHVDDLTSAILTLLEMSNPPPLINIGTGVDCTIKELSDLVSRRACYTGMIKWDNSKPDGSMAKCLDVSLMKSLGITPKISLGEGVDQLIKIYKDLKCSR